MFFHIPKQTYIPWIVGGTALTIGITIANPYTGIDIVLLGALILFLGHIFLQEKLLLLFVALQPTLDILRDTSLFQLRETAINAKAAFVVLLCLWCVYMAVKEKKNIRHIPFIFIVFGSIVFLSLASIWHSVSPMLSLIESIKLLNLFGLFVLAYVFVKNKRMALTDLALAVCVSAVVPILFGIFQALIGSGIATFGVRGRIFGTFGHPNVFALFLLFLLFLHTQYSSIEKHPFWTKHISRIYVAYGSILLLILLTYTRAALIGLLIFLFVIGIVQYRKMLLLLIGSVFFFYLIFYPLNSFLIDRFNYSLTSIPILRRITVRNEESDSIAWRISLVRENIPLIMARPLLGYGYGTFPLVWGDNRSRAHQYDDSAEAHNDYLRLALELGIPGVILYMQFLFLLARSLFIGIKKDGIHYVVPFAWVVSFIFLSLSDNMLNHTPVMWFTWSVWGAMLGQEKKHDTMPHFLH